MKVLFERLSLRMQMTALVMFGSLGYACTILFYNFGGFLGFEADKTTQLILTGGFTLLYLVLAAYVGSISGSRALCIVEALKRLSSGNLLIEMKLNGRDEFAWMAYELNCTVDSMKKTIGHVLRASQQLADSSASQVASLEEISASVEEMNSMTKSNADSCHEAGSISKKTNELVGEADLMLRDLKISIQEVADSSNDIKAIVKTIDDIAFHTNLLALNAAVEAAHAGEAGAGFAVVAAEVNNLADRTSLAAQKTERLIEDTVMKLEQGMGLLTRCSDSFEKASASVEGMMQMVTSISEASSHQAMGIDQLNSAVNQIDKKNQLNSESAHELNSVVETFELEDRTETKTNLLLQA
jgi:methyl-accepting chemotaxis protein